MFPWGGGRTRRLKIVGAPWITRAEVRDFADYLKSPPDLLGPVLSPPRSPQPLARSSAGKLCGGVNIIVTDRIALDAPISVSRLPRPSEKMFPSDYKPQEMVKLVGTRPPSMPSSPEKDPIASPRIGADDLEKFKEIRNKYLIYK